MAPLRAYVRKNMNKNVEQEAPSQDSQIPVDPLVKIICNSEFQRVFKKTHTSSTKVDLLHHLGFPLLCRKEPIKKNLLEHLRSHRSTP